MLDAAVKITRINNTIGFDPITLLPGRFVQVTYMVGDHGPFILTTPTAEFSDTYVEAETTKQANTLRSLGVVPR